MSTYARPRPRGNFELFAWLFMRVSGLALIFLVLGHVAIMHVFNNVDDLSYEFVVARWGTPFWRVYDWLLLSLALIHGLNGVRVLIDDYVHSRGWRVFSVSMLYFVGFVFLVIGSIVVFTFQPMTAQTAG